MADVLDLRGVRCPLNWAKAKVYLETLPRGAELRLIIDDPKGARDIPRAAEAAGYAVANVERWAGEWHIVIHT
ncbi:MAG: sulfurtransferase TusA family protein [Candidatus Binatia bacterium]